MGPPTMVETARDQLEAGAGAERKSGGGGGRHTHGCNCREDNDDDGDKRIEAALDAFQGKVERRLTGRMPRRGRDGKWLYLPPGGSYQGSGDSESEDIGPLETEYGCAIRCNAADYGTL